MIVGVDSSGLQPWIDKHPVLFVLAFFPILWVVVGVLISRIGGWGALAERFRYSGKFPGQRWRGQSAQMRLIGNYGNCLTVGANRDGLYLATLFVFRSGHPALMIPWTEISVVGKRAFFWRYVELRLGHDLSIPFRISESLATRLRAAAGAAWPVDSPV